MKQIQQDDAEIVALTLTPTPDQVEVCKLLLCKGLLSEELLRRWREAREWGAAGGALQSSQSGGRGHGLSSESAPFSMLLSLLAHDLFCRSPSLQEQLLQLLNAALLASDRGGEEAGAAAGVVGTGRAALPRITGQELQSLTHAISHPCSSQKAMERAMNLLKALSWESANLLACITHLVAETKAQAEECRGGLEKLLASSGSLSLDVCLGEHDVKLLRLAKTLKSLWPEAGKMAEAESEGGQGEGQVQGPRPSLAETLMQEQLWDLVGNVLKDFETPVPTTASSASPATMSPALSRLQPLVEALLIVKAPVGEKDEGGVEADKEGEREGEAAGPGEVARSRSGVGEEGMDVEKGKGQTPFLAFVEAHRATLNMYIRQVYCMLIEKVGTACDMQIRVYNMYIIFTTCTSSFMWRGRNMRTAHP
jgi:hypothetical protein